VREERPIQLVVARSDSVHQSVNRALMLARYLHASIHIVLCGNDGLHTPAEERAGESALLYMQALRKSISAPDVTITTAIALDGPLSQCAAEAARVSRALLVVRAAAGGASSPGRSDSDLVNLSPAPVLLTHGRPWHPRARFAAAIEVPERGDARLALGTARTSLTLSEACDAELDLIGAEPAGGLRMAQALRQLSETLSVPAERMHCLAGDFAEALAPFIIGKGYDLIVVGSHPCASRKDLPAAARLSSIGCDLLCVREGHG
jgi:nucleotide-binding universal stress UspA family protein